MQINPQNTTTTTDAIMAVIVW